MPDRYLLRAERPLRQRSLALTGPFGPPSMKAATDQKASGCRDSDIAGGELTRAARRSRRRRRYQTRQTRLTISFGQVKREKNDSTPDSRPGLRSSARSETGLIRQSIRPRTLAMANLTAGPPRSAGEAESVVLVAVGRRVPIAVGGAGVGRIVVPGAAAKDAGFRS